MATRGWEKARRPSKGARIGSGRRSKYGAVKTEVEGIVFASKAEARRYQELKALEREGRLMSLRLQPAFPIWIASHDGGQALVCEYVADFEYWATPDFAPILPPFDQPPFRERVIEDVKGFKTPVYRLKKKLVEAAYGIEIREIK